MEDFVYYNRALGDGMEFNQLSPSIQQRVLKKWIKTQKLWEKKHTSQLTQKFISMGNLHGFQITNLEWKLNGKKEDFITFEGDINLKEWIRSSQNLNDDEKRKILNHVQELGSMYFEKMKGFTTYIPSVSVKLIEKHRENVMSLRKEVRDLIQKDVDQLLMNMKDTGYEQIEWVHSPEYQRKHLIENNYKFDKDGNVLSKVQRKVSKTNNLSFISRFKHNLVKKRWNNQKKLDLIERINREIQDSLTE